MSAEIWQAAEFEKVIEKSRTQPLVLWCEHETKEPKRFVVKSMGHPGIYEFSLFAELFGNMLAREFSIETPEPALIELTAPFVSSVNSFLPKDVQLAVGLGVGAEYDPKITPILTDFKMTKYLKPQVAMIYAVDLLTANTDRRIGNPNCAMVNEDLVAYDFELNFSFVQTLFGGPKPWEVSQLGDILKYHVFKRDLKTSGADWTPFINNLKLLNAPQLQGFVQGFPAAWLSSSQKVIDHILTAQLHYKDLEFELQKSLNV